MRKNLGPTIQQYLRRTPHAMRTCKNNIRTLLPRREAALAKLEHDLGPINDTLNIGLCERT